MIDYLITLGSSLADSFINPQKRVFIGYLLSAGLIGLVWLLWIQRRPLREALELLFSRRIWLSASARADYLIILFNRVIMLAISPRLISQLLIATVLFEQLHQFARPEAASHWPTWLSTTLFTLTVFVLDDASRYLLHRWQHSSKLLWCFHRVHHSASVLTPLTIFRTHPVEGILFVLRSALVQGICIGLFAFAFGSGVDLATILGANLFIFFFNLLGANLRHSHVPIHYPRPLERWLMSPAQHQLHHSRHREHFDSNYGVFLSVWDRLGGTLIHSEPGRKLEFGVSDQGGAEEHQLKTLYWQPVRNAGEILWRWIRGPFVKVKSLG